MYWNANDVSIPMHPKLFIYDQYFSRQMLLKCANGKCTIKDNHMLCGLIHLDRLSELYKSIITYIICIRVFFVLLERVRCLSCANFPTVSCHIKNVEAFIKINECEQR